MTQKKPHATGTDNPIDFPTDDRETIEIRADQAELFQWMLAAHHLDITLNEFAERALQDMIKQYKDQNA